MKFKRNRLFSFLLIYLTAFALSSCSRADSGNDASDENLPELKIGVDILEPFFSIDKNGEYAGIDADIAVEACKRAGYKPVFIDLFWSDNDAYLEDGTVACIWTASVIDGQEDDYLWTNSYLESHLAIVVQRTSTCRSLDELSRHSVAVRNNSKAEELFIENILPSDSIYSCGTISMAETAFIKGYADCLVDHRLVLQELVDDNPELYRFLDDDLLTLHLGVAFRKDDTTDCPQKISDALEEMKDDGTITSIIGKYSTDYSVWED